MNLKTIVTTGVLAAAGLVVAAPAQAQLTWTDRAFVNVNLGVQASSRTLGTESTFELYGETGRLTTTQDVDGGGFFDVSGGYKVWRNLAVGIGYTRIGSDADAAIAATVPHPLFFDRPRAVTGTASGTEHSENALHFLGTWIVPVTDKLDVGVSFGPTIFLVEQDLPSAISVTEPAAAVSGTSIVRAENTTAGINLGVDVTYLVTPRFGAGVLARYTWGSADLQGATESLTVGGFQLGGGLRVRF